MRSNILERLRSSQLKLEAWGPLSLVIGMSVAFLLLLFRNLGLYAFVSDEYSYSQLSRLLPISEATVPIYLYLGLYRVTNYCGDGFLNCARLLNVFLFVLAAPFIYGVARTVTGRFMAAVVALVILAGPLNSYTAYFMPEAPYFFLFWVFTWLFLRRDIATDGVFWLSSGALLALLMLIKPHAIFLLPSTLIFALLKRNYSSPVLSKCSIKAPVQFLIAFVAIRALVGFAIAGSNSFTVFGSLYGAIADSASSNLARMLGIFTAAPKILGGHIQALTVLYGLPIAAMASTFLSIRSRAAAAGSMPQLVFYSFLTIGSLLLVTALFTASVIGTGPHETANRLHLRYYSFAIPLFLIIACGEIKQTEPLNSWRTRLIVAAPIVAGIGYCLATGLAPFAPNFIDSPEFIGLVRNQSWFYLICTASLTSLGLWVFRAKDGARCYLFAVVPLSLVASVVSTNADLRTRIHSDPYVNAGVFARQYLSEQETSRLVVAGPELGHIFRALLYLDRPRVAMEVVPASTPFALDGRDYRWLLRIGDAPTSKDNFYEIAGPGYTLSRLGDGSRINFNEGFWPGIVRRSSGLHPSESWGAWSSSDRVTFDFVKPLPDEFSVHLIARAIAGSAGKQIRARIGNSEVTFSLGEAFEEKVLPFKNLGRSDQLIFEVPAPSQPTGFDSRALSIAFSELRIILP